MEKTIKDLLEEQQSLFEQFKSANDAAQAEITKQGAASAVLTAQVEKLSAALAEIGSKIDDEIKQRVALETRFNRPGAIYTGPEAVQEAKALASFNLGLKIYWQSKSRPFTDLTADEYTEYRRLFGQYCRYGQDGWLDAEKRAMQVGSDADGGYWVPSDTAGRMIARVFETSQIRQIANVQAISRDALEGIIDNDEAGAGWVAETAPRPATTTPQIGMWRIAAYEQYAMPEATQTLLDDAVVDVEAWLAGKVADKFTRLEETAFVVGDGVGKPRGFASYPSVAVGDGTRPWGQVEHVNTGTAGGWGADPAGADTLLEVVYKLKAAYRTGARWVMNKATLGSARTLKDGGGSYVWLPTMDADRPSTLLGYPVSEAEDMPTYTTTNALAVAFGNFNLAYQIVDRQGIRVLRDPYTNKPFVRFYSTRRVGGDLLHFEAVKFVRFSV